MKFLNYIQEEWVAHVKGHWNTMYSGESDVFENPSKKELSQLKPDVRFFVNFKTKKVYVWDWDITHSDMAEQLVKEKLVPTNNIGQTFMKTCFAGIGKIEAGKIVYSRQSDCIYSIEKHANWLYSDDEWTLQYFRNNLIEDIKRECGIKAKEAGE